MVINCIAIFVGHHHALSIITKTLEGTIIIGVTLVTLFNRAYGGTLKRPCIELGVV